MRIRIINKSKDGVVLDFKGKGGTNQLSISWDEFNKNFKISEKVWAEPREEFVKSLEEVNEHIALAAASFFQARSQDPKLQLGGFATLGAEVDFIQKRLGCTVAEATELIKRAVDSMMKFAAPNPKSKKKPADGKKGSWKKPVNKQPQVISSSGAYRPTLGDHPEFEKLRELVKNKKK